MTMPNLGATIKQPVREDLLVVTDTETTPESAIPQIGESVPEAPFEVPGLGATQEFAEGLVQDLWKGKREAIERIEHAVLFI